MKEDVGLLISISFIYHRINKLFGLCIYRPFLCLPLTPIHRTRRLNWCNEQVNNSNNGIKWYSVTIPIFMCVHDEETYAWRTKKLRVLCETPNCPYRGSDGIGCNIPRRSSLVFVSFNVNATIYITNVL
jgi:hypothetical protein